MIVIVDTNILISACLKPEGKISRLLNTANNKIDFLIPEFALSELNDHLARITEQTNTDSDLFLLNLSVIVEKAVIYPDHSVSNQDLTSAEKLTKNIDIDDTIFVAFAIAMDSLLWTGDLKLYRALKKKKFNQVLLTRDLENIIKGL